MQNPRFFDDMELKRQIKGYLEKSLQAGDYDAVKAWVPDSSRSLAMLEISNRNIATIKLRGAAYSIERRILTYLSSLIRGLLQPVEETNYLQSRSIRGDQLKFPIQSIHEVDFCLKRLAVQRERDYEQSLERLITNQLDSDSHWEAWRTVGVGGSSLEEEYYQFTGSPYTLPSEIPPEHNVLYDHQRLKVPRVRRALLETKPILIPVDEVPPVWNALVGCPKSYADSTWQARVPREKLISISAKAAVLEPDEDNHWGKLDPSKSIEEIYSDLSKSLASRKKEVSKQLKTHQLALETLLVDAQLSFENYQADTDEAEELAEELNTLYGLCLQKCQEIAWLEAEDQYVHRFEKLHLMHKMSSYEKLVELASWATQQNTIPVNLMAEFRDQIEYLIQHLDRFCTDGIKELLWHDKVYVNAEGQCFEMSERKIKDLGIAVAGNLRRKFGSLLMSVSHLNTAEAKREQAERQLGKLLEKLVRRLGKMEEKVEQGEDAVMAEREKLSACIRYHTELEMRRRNKLIELACCDVNPDAVKSFEQLCALYEGSLVTEELLRELCGRGFMDIDHLLSRAAHLEDEDRLQLCLHFLSEGARASYNEENVGALAQAYDAITHGVEGSEEQALNWQVFASLRCAQELFETEENADWLATSTTAVLDVVRAFSGARLIAGVNAYQQRDCRLVEVILRRLILSVYLNEVNLVTISRAPLFQQLCSIWQYLEVRPEDAPLPEALPGEVGGITLAGLHSSLLACVQAIFSSGPFMRAIALRDHLLTSVPVAGRISDEDRHNFVEEVVTHEIVEALRAQLRVKVQTFRAGLAPLVDSGALSLQRALAMEAEMFEVPAVLQQDRVEPVVIRLTADSLTRRREEDEEAREEHEESREEQAEVRDEQAEVREEQAEVRDEQAEVRDARAQRAAVNDQAGGGAAAAPAAEPAAPALDARRVRRPELLMQGAAANADGSASEEEAEDDDLSGGAPGLGRRYPDID